jgi:hypothetical protein
VGIVSERYGQLNYGSGLYKGYADDDAFNAVPGLASNDYKKCFHLALKDEQGAGWDECNGDDWIWPESQGCVYTVFDRNGLQKLIVEDENTGLPYIINPRIGPNESGLTSCYKDKVDPNVAGSGTEISCTVKLPEHSGEMLHYSIEHGETYLHLRPMVASNRGASGYTTDGMRTGFSLTAKLYEDGKATDSSEIASVNTDREIIHDRGGSADSTLQHEFSTNRSEWRFLKTESYYKVSDGPKIPYKGNTTEASHELEFASPTAWIGRGGSNLVNKADGTTLAGAATATTGPDGISASALTITAAVSLGNSAISNGTLLVWHKTGYTISGVSLTQVGTSGTWILSSATGALPASIELGTGDVFDVRLFSSAISSAAITHYYNDVTENSGKVYLD